MATQTLPHVVQFPQSVPTVISQDELTTFVALRQRIEALEAEWKQAEAKLRAAVEADRPVEPGIEDYAKRVLAATKPDTHTTLVVTA